MGPVGILGYGRFGRALGRRLDELGVEVVAHDPLAPVSPPLGVGSVADLALRAETVVLAIPVPATRAALEVLKPHLRDDQLVVEVGSVKVEPQIALNEVLGAQLPWVATHPLFGPVSLDRGERPLRVVVCPNPAQPAAEARGIRFWTTLECEVAVQDAEVHDQVMARTHALAFFLAKGFERCRIDLEDPFLPPSVSGLARTVSSARADAGQLLATLHRHNPYADEARAAFLEALVATDAALRAPAPPDEAPHHEAEELRLVVPAAPELQEVRDLIDELDAELLALLARRAALALRARTAKESHGRPIADPRREEELLVARREAAAAAGLDPSTVEDVFRSIVRFSRHHQATRRRRESDP